MQTVGVPNKLASGLLECVLTDADSITVVILFIDYVDDINSLARKLMRQRVMSLLW